MQAVQGRSYSRIWYTNNYIFSCKMHKVLYNCVLVSAYTNLYPSSIIIIKAPNVKCISSIHLPMWRDQRGRDLMGAIFFLPHYRCLKTKCILEHMIGIYGLLVSNQCLFFPFFFLNGEKVTAQVSSVAKGVAYFLVYYIIPVD